MEVDTEDFRNSSASSSMTPCLRGQSDPQWYGRAMADAREAMRRVIALLDEMEQLQKTKVVELARRLKPGLTAEDIRNPHDFPDLDDPDWHFEDGQLTGIQAARFALQRLASDLVPDAEEGEEGSQGG